MPGLVLKDIPFDPALGKLMQRLHIKPGSEDADTLTEMLAVARTVARPKSVYHVGLVERNGSDTVVIDDVALTSRILQVNLGEAHRIFVFVATGGTELEDWAALVEGLLERFWADAIMELALEAALHSLRNDIDTRYNPGHMSMMNPGSLDDWPLSEQRALFDVLGDMTDAIGVQLTDSLLMRPAKSASGVFFATEDDFESCQLCPIEHCPNRRAAYDGLLYQARYSQ